MRSIFITLILILIMMSLSALEVPTLMGRVNDRAGILTDSEEVQLERILLEAEQATSSQIALLTIPSLEGEVLEDYALKVAESWKLGQEEFDNGLLLLVAMAEKELRIEVGYGLESIITDAKSGYIIRNIIVPEFKKGNFYQGIYIGLTAISGLITDEFEISDEELARYQKEMRENKKGRQLPLGFIVFWIIFFLIGIGRRRRGGLLPLLLLGSALGRGGRSSGFGGFGGFSGGGGSFGGGGASGGW